MNNHSRVVLFAAILATTILAGGCNKAPEVTATQAADNVADIDVTSNVKRALLKDESLKDFDITVVTLKGDVRLIGELPNQAQIDQAIKIARASDGAHTIHDELTIKK
jgi:osmotically-inducible protein OsmY